MQLTSVACLSWTCKKLSIRPHAYELNVGDKLAANYDNTIAHLHMFPTMPGNQSHNARL
jgi:hypothetical protein